MDDKKDEKTIAKELDQDIIREVGNILSNHSATAFSKMIQENINISTDVELVSVKDFTMELILTDEISEIFSEMKKRYISGYFLKTTAGVEGISLLLFNEDHIEKLVNTVADKMGNATQDEEERKEILKEFSSIAMNAYLSALSNLIDAKIQASTPIPATDILGSIYDFKEHLKEGDKNEALMIKTDIVAKETGITGKLTILLEPESYEKILNLLRKKSGY